MKATELRIGNYVQDPNGNVCKVVTIDNDDSHKVVRAWRIDKPHLGATDITPIPLSEESLKGFGFRKRLINNKFWEYYRDCTPPNYKRGHGYVLRYWDWNKQMDFGPVMSGNIHHFPCEYIHQLQNLYFALTGKELIPKQKP